MSPQGAYDKDLNLTGRANFGFVSAYKKGMSVPTGETKFQFQAAGLDFKSTNYTWLIVTGANCAKYKGSGTVNGNGQYGFILTACDKVDGDTFRIQIFDAKNESDGVYDNFRSATNAIDDYNGTVIGG
jgi:hypothetical protein